MGARGSQQAKKNSQPLGLVSNTSKSLEDNNDTNRIELKSPLEMPMSHIYKCGRCGMTFSSDEALYKHRTRFCLGAMSSSTGKLNYSDDENLNPRMTPSRTLMKYASPVDKKRDEINEWKNQRSVLQSVQDMEDRILRDSQKTQRLANDLKKRTGDYNQILVEYERLQTKEQDLLRQMFNLQGQSGSHSNQLNDHDLNQLEALQRQSDRLEQERRTIQNRLEELIANDYQPTNLPHYEPYRLLRDMKDEQDRNEKSLVYLRRRLVYPNSDLLSMPYFNSPRQTTIEDVRPLHYDHRYSSPVTYSDLDHRLRQYEHYPWMRDFPEPLRRLRYHPIETAADRVINTQMENQRLQGELDNMERRFRKLDSRTRQLELTVESSRLFEPPTNGYHNYSSATIPRYQPIRSSQYTSVRPGPANYDSDIFDQQQRQYHQSTLPPLDRRITSHVTQSMNNLNPNTSQLRDPLGPQPYDPIGGFVVFFDFIIKLPSTIDQCRLISCLNHPDSGLGEPSQLRVIQTDLYGDEATGERMSSIIIATKQPVPSCPANQGLSIVIEVQVTTRQTPNDLLRTNAWIKLPLFDHRNRLISGRWKVPLKALPIYQNESFPAINALPSYGRAELFYRLVNAQDAFTQSNAPLSPSSRDLYFYPPPYRNGTYM